MTETKQPARLRLITFLGVSNYFDASYALVAETGDGQRRFSRLEPDRPGKFSQLALASIMSQADPASQRGSPLFDRITVFATQEAVDKNWTVLADEFSRLQADDGPLASVVLEPPVIIQPKSHEEALWEMAVLYLDAIRRAAADGREIVADLTHGLRYQPFSYLMTAEYLSNLTNQKIHDITYGAFELKNEYDGVVPIFSLKPLLEVIEWSRSINIAVQQGDFRHLANLTRELGKEDVCNSIGRAANWQNRDLFPAFNQINGYMKQVNEFASALMECRLRALRPLACSTAQLYVQCQSSLKRFESSHAGRLESHFASWLLAAIEMLNASIKPFATEDTIDGRLAAGSAAITWALKHQRTIHAAAYVNEMVYEWMELESDDLQKSFMVGEWGGKAWKFKNEWRVCCEELVGYVGGDADQKVIHAGFGNERKTWIEALWVRFGAILKDANIGDINGFRNTLIHCTTRRTLSSKDDSAPFDAQFEFERAAQKLEDAIRRRRAERGVTPSAAPPLRWGTA